MIPPQLNGGNLRVCVLCLGNRCLILTKPQEEAFTFTGLEETTDLLSATFEQPVDFKTVGPIGGWLFCDYHVYFKGL